MTMLLILASCMIIKKRYLDGYRFFAKTGKKSPPVHLVNNPKQHDVLSQEVKNETAIYASAEKTNHFITANEITSQKSITEDTHAFRKSQASLRKSLHNSGKQKSVRRSKLKKNSPPEPVGNPWELTGKDKTLAIILCVLLGSWGIHRFYLGYTGMGCIYMLTGGLFLVGCSVDFVRLLLDDLGPKVPEHVQNQKEREIKNNPNLSGPQVKNSIIAEPYVSVKDAKNGILELSLIYNSNSVGKSIIGFRYHTYSKDENNDPYYQTMPAYDSVKTHQLLMERCQSLGFRNYRKYSGYRKECAEKNSGASGICTKYKAVIECQCTN